MLIDKREDIDMVKRAKLNSTVAKIFLRCSKCKKMVTLTVSKIEVYTAEVKKSFKCWRCK